MEAEPSLAWAEEVLREPAPSPPGVTGSRALEELAGEGMTRCVCVGKDSCVLISGIN